MSTNRPEDADRDEDALSWEGDDDPAFATGRARSADRPSVSTPVAADAPAATTAARDEHWALASSPAVEAARGQGAGNVALVALGVLGGIYALLTVGWIVGGLRLQAYALFFVAPVAFQVSLWLAVLAPAAWFGTVLLLTRSGRRWVRFLLLVAGAVLLPPWPFVMIGAVGV